MSPAASPPRVLLVDDNADNLALMQLFLAGGPYTVECAVNGREAVEKCAAAPYDFVFMDLEMPLLDGYDATRAIRETERREGRRAAPIVVLTAHALDEFRQRCEAAGCTDFLVKPVRKQAVAACLAKHLGVPTPPPAPPVRSTVPAPDLELLRPIFPIFFATADATLDAARQALDRHDMEDLRRQGHKLKGSALSYGFDDLGRAALNLERAGTASDAAAGAAALDRARTLLAQARAAYPD